MNTCRLVYMLVNLPGEGSVIGGSKQPPVPGGPALVARRAGGLGLLGTAVVLALVIVFLLASLWICLQCCRGGPPPIPPIRQLTFLSLAAGRRNRRDKLNLQKISNGFFGDSGGRSHKVGVRVVAEEGGEGVKGGRCRASSGCERRTWMRWMTSRTTRTTRISTPGPPLAGPSPDPHPPPSG